METPQNPRMIQIESFEDELVKSHLLEIENSGGLKLNRENDRSRRNKVIEEVKKQVWLAGPLIIVRVMQYCLQLISLMFVGHLGQLSLSSASIATSFTSLAGFSLLTGMASALDTLCGQSYGAQQLHTMGIILQRAVFVLSLVSIPVAILWANTEHILIFAHQDSIISKEAGLYVQLMIPGLFAFGPLQCLDVFIQSQNKAFPLFLCTAITTLLHFPVCWFLVLKTTLKSRGAALAVSISYWVNTLLLALYVRFSPSFKKTWIGFSKEAFRNLRSFIILAIPSAVMFCLEIWSFEIMVLLSGLLPNPELETSVLSVSLDTYATVCMIPFGLSCVVSTRVSNELGAGHSEAAHLAVFVALVMVIILGLVIGLTMIFMRNIWGYAFTNDIEVLKYLATLMPILAVSSFIDGFQSILSGIARGCGWQKIGVYVNLGSYYLVGIPCGIALTFLLHIGGKGLWLGIICALMVQVTSLFIITCRTNWKLEAKKATERVYGSITPTTTMI